MNLTLTAEIVTFPASHYVFVEKIGPFMQNAGAAWTEAHTCTPALSEHNQITGYMSLYKMGPQVYRAGFALSAAPKELPKGLTYEKFAGSEYSRFVLTGAYSDCPGSVPSGSRERDASGPRRFCDRKLRERSPRVTPEPELKTEFSCPCRLICFFVRSATALFSQPRQRRSSWPRPQHSN